MHDSCIFAHTHIQSLLFCSYGAHTFVVWVLYEIVRGCVCVFGKEYEHARVCVSE